MSLFQTLSQSRYVLVPMVLIQALWVAVIWFTGASTRSDKLLILGIYTVIAGLALILIPASILENSRVRLFFANSRRYLIASLFAVALVVGLLYARDQRGWTWDEEHSFEAAQIVAADGVGAFFDYYADNPWLGKQHPPLVPLINGLAMSIFGQHLLVIRLTSLAFAFGTFAVTYLLGRELYDHGTGLFAMILVMSFPLIFRLGTAALTDMQVTFFFSLSLYLALRLIRAPSWSTAVLLGLTVGIGLLSKYTMIFIGPVLLVFFVTNRSFRSRALYLTGAGLVAFLLLGTWLFFAWQIGVLEQQQELVNIDPTYYVGSAIGLKQMANSLLTRLTSSIGTYNLPIILFAGIFFIRRRDSSDLLLLLWVSTISLLLIFTLPDHRYFMPTFPALAIMMAAWLAERPAINSRVALLSLLYNAGALWLFIDWYREAELFLSG